MRLSANFTLQEFVKSQTATRQGIDNTPNEEHLASAKELFENVCLIADLSNPKSLAEKIEEGLNNYPEKLIKNGLEKVIKFGSRQVEMKKLLKLYRK